MLIIPHKTKFDHIIDFKRKYEEYYIWDESVKWNFPSVMANCTNFEEKKPNLMSTQW